MQEGLLAAYFYTKTRRVRGPAFQRRLASLRESERFDEDRLASLQRRGLRTMVEAARHAPHYERLFRRHGIDPDAIRQPGDLAALPILDKQSLRECPEDFVDARRDRRRLRVVPTSGSTGTPLRVYCDGNFEALEEAFLARQWMWAGLSLDARRVKLRGDVVVTHGQVSQRPWRRNPALHELRMSSYHLSAETAPDYVTRMGEFAAAALVAYPSSAAVLAAFVREGGLDCRFTAVFTSSETLLASQRTLIESALGTRVFDHYGLTEGVAAIQQCELGSYHVIPEYGIVELVPVEGAPEGVCDIVATGLLNTAMPLLRYRTGDQAIVGREHSCRCARAFPRIEGLAGREADIVLAASGARVPAVDAAMTDVQAIVEAQIIQANDLGIRVLVVPGADYGDAVAAEIRRNVRQRVGDLPVTVETVESIPRGPNGKFRPVVSYAVPSPHDGEGPALVDLGGRT